MGAYLGLVTPGVPILGAFMFNAIYKFPAYRFDCTNVFTNKTWTDAYRGAGRPEATFAIERMMDELAVELGMDPLELREKNWIKHEEFPFTTVAGLEYDSGNYEAATAKAKELFGYDALRAEQQQRRDAATRSSSASASPPSPRCAAWRRRGCSARCATAAGGWEHATIRMLPTGKVEVVTGTSPHGQGHETAWSQIVADQLGVAFEDVEVLHGDTQVSPKGLDTYGSRSLAVGGMAVVKAADKVIEKAKPIAAHLLEASADDLEFAAGSSPSGAPTGHGDRRGRVRGLRGAQPAGRGGAVASTPTRRSTPTTSRSRTARTCARRGGHRDRRGHDPQLRLRRRHRQGGQPADRRGPGARRSRPGHRPGAVRGGRLRRAGTLVTGSFVDYLVPSAADLPRFTTDRTETPSTTNPLGVKGVGEAGTIASTPAVVNAVVDALRPWASRRRDAVHAAPGVAGDPGGSSAATAEQAQPMRRRRQPAAYTSGTVRQEATSDPGGVRLPRTHTSTRRCGARGCGDEGKVLAGGQSLLPVLRLRLAAPEVVVDLGRIDELRGVRDDGDAHRHRRDDHRTTTVANDPLVAEHARCWPRRRRPWPTRRCATAARSAARWRTPTRPVTCRRRRWRWTPSS